MTKKTFCPHCETFSNWVQYYDEYRGEYVWYCLVCAEENQPASE